jgi:exodeoxyribonuclease V beta subunit
MIRDVVSSDIPEFDLEKVSSRDQLREMGFHFLASQPSLNSILSIIRGSGKEALSEQQKRSFLIGFIDLVVRQNGRYYILDYKSNYLGDTVEDYNTGHLKEEILAASYDVQYYLYTVALIKYLKSRKPDFDYEKDFGGVIYLFVRGMRKDKKHGIWFHKPDMEVIHKLEEELEVRV